MNDERRAEALEPTIPGAVWQHRWLVLLLGVVGGALGVAFALAQPGAWQATSSLVVEDPRASAVFELGAAQRPERYVENQVEIIKSPAVAQRASELLAAGSPSHVVDADAVEAAATVRSRSDRDLITISFEDGDRELARAAADALAVAYQEVRRSEAARNFEAALVQLDESIARGQAELEALQARIAENRASGPSQDALISQFGAAVDRLAAVQADLLAGTVSAEEVAAELDELRDQFATFQLVLGIESLQPGLNALVEQQSEAIARLSVLIARRDQIAVDSEIAGSGVLLFSPAGSAVETGTALSRALPVGVLLGLLVGAGLAYWLVLRRRTFAGRGEPELVLDAPLIAEVPDFAEERIKGSLPVVESPASVAAEAFRFAASVLDVRPVAGAGDLELRPAIRSVVVVAADPGDGTSVVSANLALAAARAGKRVLLVDADFGNQQAAHLLAPGAPDQRGLTDVVLAEVDLESAVTPVGRDGGTALYLMGRGRNTITAPEFFALPVVRRYFEAFRSDFDLVVIDTPPLLHVAYAGGLVQFGDRALVVVPHGSSVAAVEDLRDRLRLLGAPVAGYIYNRSPLRREMAVAGGSTADVLGGAGTEPVRTTPQPDRWSPLRRKTP